MTEWYLTEAGTAAHRDRGCSHLEGHAVADVLDDAALARSSAHKCTKCRYPDPPTLD